MTIVWISTIVWLISIIACVIGLLEEIDEKIVIGFAISMVVSFWVGLITWLTYEKKHPAPMEFPVDKYKLEYKIIQQGEKCDTIYILTKKELANETRR